MEFQPMSPEERQRTMQFLLNQQAQFAADCARNEARWAEQHGLLSAKIDRVTDSVGGLTAIVGQLAAAQLRTDARVDDVGAYIKTVEAHLNVVVDMFERHLREDHRQQTN